MTMKSVCALALVVVAQSLAADRHDHIKRGHHLSLVPTKSSLLAKVQSLEVGDMVEGSILVNGPLPANFAELFSQAVGAASSVDSKEVAVMKTEAIQDHSGYSTGRVMSIDFQAPTTVVKDVEVQAANPDSKLARGKFHSFLVAEAAPTPGGLLPGVDDSVKAAPAPRSPAAATPVQEKGFDIDTAMPYGDLEPFGREDTAQELTESSVREGDEMVDQLERAEVAEEKRAVFRALTRLRGAAITSFDGVARSQTGSIDEYNKVHKWRKTHPLHHLADEESDVAKWAFPDNADF